MPSMKAVVFGLMALAIISCSSVPSPTITVTDAKVQTWKSDKDGNEYVVIVPTWRNEGPGAVSEVWMAGRLKGPKGEFELQGSEKPLYRGDELPEGTTFHPTNFPEDFIVAGLAEEVLSITGPNPSVEVDAYGTATTSPEPEPKADAVP